MDFYTELPEWHAEGEAPPQPKRNEGWNPEERVPASWLNWFFHRTYESLREIAQAFIYHRDASAPHDGHETKEGANAKVKAHSDQKSGVHGVGPNEYLAKTSRSDQRVGWDDIVNKPSQFPMSPHDHDDRYYTKSQSDSRYAPIRHSHGAADLPKASTSQEGVVRLTNDRTSRSETLALTARAMDDHRLSADHDGRYYTKTAIDQMLQGRSSVAVITGVANHGDLIPLPPGYSANQCHILVSIRHFGFQGWDRDTVKSITCYVDSQRRLFCRATDFRGRNINGTANYMVIGIK